MGTGAKLLPCPAARRRALLNAFIYRTQTFWQHQPPSPHIPISQRRPPHTQHTHTHTRTLRRLGAKPRVRATCARTTESRYVRSNLREQTIRDLRSALAHSRTRTLTRGFPKLTAAEQVRDGGALFVIMFVQISFCVQHTARRIVCPKLCVWFMEGRSKARHGIRFANSFT